MRETPFDSADGPTTPIPFDGVVDQYLAGQLPDAEARSVRAQVETRPEWRRFLHVTRAWGRESDIPTPPDVADAVQRLEARLRADDDVRRPAVFTSTVFTSTVLTSTVFKGRYWTRGRMATLAGIVAATMIAVVGVSRSKGRASELDSSSVYTTAVGQRATITLRDGSRVILAPATTVRLTAFGSTARDVSLQQGEAYFEVAHADGAPFVVRSGAVSTKVLGTRFLVRRYPGDAAVRIAVVTGRVRVTPGVLDGHGMTVGRGTVVDASDSTVTVQTGERADDQTRWVDGELVFHDVPATRVLETLSHWYGYQFRYADSALMRQNVTAWISTQSSTEALAALQRVLSVSLRVSGDTVTLVPQAAKTMPGATRLKAYDVWTPTREVGR